MLAPPLAASIATHDIEVVVRTASGTALDGREGRAELSNFRVLPRGRAWGGTAWSRGVGRVVIRDVSEGRVQIEAVWSRGWFPCEPAAASFDVPGGSPELLVRDDLPAEELIVRVIEPEIGGRGTVHADGRVNFEDGGLTVLVRRAP